MAAIGTIGRLTSCMLSMHYGRYQYYRSFADLDILHLAAISSYNRSFDFMLTMQDSYEYYRSFDPLLHEQGRYQYYRSFADLDILHLAKDEINVPIALSAFRDNTPGSYQ